ncbi:MAG: type I-U CRISPR-associated protein Cas5/Cas6 [Microthrixaceae bacterium]|nr:type I-U CRISPR-associated protein Cas5/Cas6 [Microthrixaceae bacterium]
MITTVEAPPIDGVTIAVTFPLGRYHATAMGTSANDGVVEWPPSPWRLLRTFYAVWKTRCSDLDTTTVSSLLAALGTPPQFHLDERTAVGHTRHYMPGEKSGAESTMLVHDTFVVCAADRPALWITWPDVTLSQEQRSALGRLCSSITWLGRAESLADARLLDAHEQPPTPNSFLVPESSTDAGVSPIRLLVPTMPLNPDSLTVRLSDLRENIKTRSTLPSHARLRTFVRPAPVTVRPPQRRLTPPARPQAVRFSVVPNEAGRSATRLPLAHALVHTSALRVAAMAVFGRRNDGAPSAALSGRSGDGHLVGHSHAHYLPMPGDGITAPADRVDTFLVWAPGGFDMEELEALRSVRNVKGFPWVPASRPFRVIADGAGTVADLAPDMCGPATTWRSVTPAVAGRHPKGKRSWEDQMAGELLTDCAERGLPAPEIELGPWEGHFTTSRPRPGRAPHRAHPHRYRIHLCFDQPIAAGGILALGAMSHFGLGLFIPV